MDALSKVVESFAQGGYFVVLDGIIGPWFIEPFQVIDATIHYIVLLPPVERAIQRCQTRGGDALTDPAPITDLDRQFSDLGQLEKHSIHLDSETPEVVIAKVLRALESLEYILPHPKTNR